MRAIFDPTVSMILQPPAAVPRPMVNAQTRMTPGVIVNSLVMPPASMVSANTPMNF